MARRMIGIDIFFCETKNTKNGDRHYKQARQQNEGPFLRKYFNEEIVFCND